MRTRGAVMEGDEEAESNYIQRNHWLQRLKEERVEATRKDSLLNKLELLVLDDGALRMPDMFNIAQMLFQVMPLTCTTFFTIGLNQYNNRELFPKQERTIKQFIGTPLTSELQQKLQTITNLIISLIRASSDRTLTDYAIYNSLLLRQTTNASRSDVHFCNQLGVAAVSSTTLQTNIITIVINHSVIHTT